MSSIDAALRVLRQGGVVACPTETLVGLLADAENPRAVEAVLRVKGRGAEKAIALLVPGLESARALAELSPEAEALAVAHWPGPLTIVARARGEVQGALTRDGKVGMRVPGPSLAQALVARFGGPLTATSANRAGEPAVASTRDLDPRVRSAVDMVLEGESPGGPPSTLVDVSGDAPRVLRAGAVLLDL
jgi:L-threonylcarbamoyladenylate synthase